MYLSVVGRSTNTERTPIEIRIHRDELQLPLKPVARLRLQLLFLLRALPVLQSIQRLRVAGAVAAAEPPPAPVPASEYVHHHPPDGTGHRRPRRPHPILVCPVQVQKAERHHVRQAGLGQRLLAPDLECRRRVRGFRAALGRRGGQFRECRNRLDLGVEVVVEGLAEGVHDADELLAVEGRGRGQGCQVCVERGETLQERFCRVDFVSGLE